MHLPKVRDRKVWCWPAIERHSPLCQDRSQAGPIDEPILLYARGIECGHFLHAQISTLNTFPLLQT